MRWELGQRASFTKTVSECDVYLFAGITGDFNPVHVDERSAENSIFGERIVHGILVAGLISNLTVTVPSEFIVTLSGLSCAVQRESTVSLSVNKTVCLLPPLSAFT